jgi:hypothetical protein
LLSCASTGATAPHDPQDPASAHATLQLFPTDHLIVRAKYRALRISFYGTPWAALPARISAAAAAAGLGDVSRPLASPLALPPPADPGSPPPQLLLGAPEPPAAGAPPAPPFEELPPQLAAVLLGAVAYWRAVRLRLRSIQASPPGARLRGVAAAADAVLSSLRGDGAALAQLLSTPAADLLPGGASPLAPLAPLQQQQRGGGGGAGGAGGRRGRRGGQQPQAAAAALVWDAVAEADALEMAASWGELLLSPRTQPPHALDVAVTGLTAGVLLAAAPRTAARLLAPAGQNGAWLVRAVRGEGAGLGGSMGGGDGPSPPRPVQPSVTLPT